MIALDFVMDVSLGIDGMDRMVMIMDHVVMARVMDDFVFVLF